MMVTTICRARAIQSHPAQERIKLVGRTTIGRQLGHLERASTAVWVVKKGVNRALPRRHIISGGHCTDRALSDSTRNLFDVVEAMKTFQHAPVQHAPNSGIIPARILHGPSGAPWKFAVTR